MDYSSNFNATEFVIYNPLPDVDRAELAKKQGLDLLDGHKHAFSFMYEIGKRGDSARRVLNPGDTLRIRGGAESRTFEATQLRETGAIMLPADHTPEEYLLAAIEGLRKAMAFYRQFDEAVAKRMFRERTDKPPRDEWSMYAHEYTPYLINEQKKKECQALVGTLTAELNELRNPKVTKKATTNA